jgi:predicted secreted hydrolase
MRRLRRGHLLLLFCLVLAGTAAAATAPRVSLPADHHGHPGAGIEWWYATGTVRGGDGARYSVFFTVFSRAGFVIPVSQVVNLDTGQLVGKTEVLARRTPSASRLDVRATGHRLLYQPQKDTWRFAASGKGYALDLTATPVKPYTLHGGGTGVIAQSAAGASAYYSATRMRATGSITTGGTRVPFTGEAWLDHQWGDFADDPRALNWDWFACRFDDRTELMLYRFRERDGTPLARHRSGTFVSRDGPGRSLKAFSVAPGVRVLEAAGRRWPLDWRLSVPALSLRLTLTSVVEDQLVRGVALPTFWEGVATATGSKTGTCFVEQSYA